MGLSHSSLALYLLLISVSDGEGLSYWSDRTICETLDMTSSSLREATAELEKADLVAYAAPIFQILSIPVHEVAR